MAEILIPEELGTVVYPCTQRLLDEAAKMADLPIAITTYQRDDGISASFHLACKDEDHHEISVNTPRAYRDGGPDLVNWYLAHEATHAIRDFTVPPEQRRVVKCRDAKDAYDAEFALVMKALEQGLHSDPQADFDRLFEWERIMACSLGVPEDIEVDRHVWQRCPELRGAYAELHHRKQREVECLLCGNSPFWEPLTSMMCATLYPLLWMAGALMGKNLMRVFYNHPEASKTGKELLSIVRQREPGLLRSIEAEEQWIKALGLEDLFWHVTPSEVSSYDESKLDDIAVQRS